MRREPEQQMALWANITITTRGVAEMQGEPSGAVSHTSLVPPTSLPRPAASEEDELPQAAQSDSESAVEVDVNAHFVPELLEQPERSPHVHEAPDRDSAFMQRVARCVVALPARHAHGYPLRNMIFTIKNTCALVGFVQIVFATFVMAATLHIKPEQDGHWHYFREGLFLLDSTLIAIGQFPGQCAVNQFSVRGALYLAFALASHVLAFANWTISRFFMSPDIPNRGAAAFDISTAILLAATNIYLNFAFLAWSYWFRLKHEVLLPDNTYQLDIHHQAISLLIAHQVTPQSIIEARAREIA